MATYSSILAGSIPWTEEPGGLQSMGVYIKYICVCVCVCVCVYMTSHGIFLFLSDISFSTMPSRSIPVVNDEIFFFYG